MKQLYVTQRNEWRLWLEQNFRKENEVWLLFYKKGTDKLSLDYAAAVEEALCFGWIDGIIKKIDDQVYARRFSPRKGNSYWSSVNRSRAERLIETGRMTKPGQDRIDEAKKTGHWTDKPFPNTGLLEMPPEFEQALARHPAARHNFEKLAPSHQKKYIQWLCMAKRPETRLKRTSEAIRLLDRDQKLGLK